MRFAPLLTLVLTVVCPLTAVGGDPPHVTAHVDIYKEADRFSGWPANHGIWVWDNEIVVGFILGYHKEQEGHTIDSGRPIPRMQARSLDGGRTWAIEETSLVSSDGEARDSTSLPRPVDFTDPNFAAWLMHDRFSYSLDRCHT